MQIELGKLCVFPSNREPTSYKHIQVKLSYFQCFPPIPRSNSVYEMDPESRQLEQSGDRKTQQASNISDARSSLAAHRMGESGPRSSQAAASPLGIPSW